jgi:hypothetical protein
MFNNYYKGKLYLKIDSCNPFYVKGGIKRDICIKDLFHIGRYHLSLRCDDSREFKEEIKKKLLKVFDTVEGTRATFKENVYFLSDCLYIVKNIDYMEPTKNECVLYNSKDNKYICYSHRGFAMFGIGDYEFDGNTCEEEITDKEKDEYYKNWRYRWKYIMCLIKYHFNGDWNMFRDMVENNTISSGIFFVIPYNKRGTNKITTNAQAFKSAASFAEYIS